MRIWNEVELVDGGDISEEVVLICIVRNFIFFKILLFLKLVFIFMEVRNVMDLIIDDEIDLMKDEICRVRLGVKFLRKLLVKFNGVFIRWLVWIL